MRPATVIVKPCSDLCNIRCDYCYHNWLKVPNMTMQSRRMTIEIIDILLKNLSLLPQQNVKIIWHGGEPLLSGKEFFSYVVKAQGKYPGKFLNSIQTNGILIDGDWIEIFQRGKFNVGVSIDGPKNLHDMLRKDKDNKGTFDNVIHGVKLLQSEKIDVGPVSVITKHNYKYAKEIFDFFFDQGLLRLNFSPCAEEYLPYSLTSDEWAIFLLDLFDCWISKDDPAIKITPLESFVHGLIGGNATVCYYGKDCSNFISVDHHGNVYICGRTLGMNDYRIGDLRKQNFVSMLDSEEFRRVRNKNSDLSQSCLSCRWLNVCNGGCPLHRDQGDIRNYHFCKAMKIVLPEIEKRIKDFI